MTTPSDSGTIVRTCAIATLAASLAVSGCAGMGSTLSQRYADPTDRCAGFRQPLIEAGDSFSESVATGAAIGTIGGALLGALLAPSQDRLTGALIGGASGAALGAGAGYFQALQNQARNQQELLTAIDSDAKRDRMQLGRLGMAVKTLEDCRQEEMASLRRDVQAGHVSREQGRQQVEKIDVALRTDGELISEVMGSVDSRVNTYIEARAQALGTPEPLGGGSTVPPSTVPPSTVPSRQMRVSSGSASSGGEPQAMKQEASNLHALTESERRQTERERQALSVLLAA